MQAHATLRDYQQHLLDRFCATTGSDASSSHLAFEAGEWTWVVPLTDVSEVVPLPPLVSVPLCADWLIGVANIRGSLYAVTDLARFAITAHTRITPDCRLVLLHARYRVHAALLISRSLGLRQMRALPRRDVDGSSWQGSAFEDSDGQGWRELNVAELTRTPRFLQVALEAAKCPPSLASISQENP